MRRALPALLAVACTGAPPASPPLAGTRPPDPERVVLRGAEVTGLSALARHPDGSLWAAPERDRTLLVVERDGTTRPVALTGVAAGVDIEAASWIDADRLALGTERNPLPGAPPSQHDDAILIARREAAAVVVTDVIPLDHDLWAVDLSANEGIEGLCTAGGALYLGIETVLEKDGQRYAPLARHDLATGAWTAYLLRLSSPVGSLSALGCRERGGAIEAVAVERHFGVSRLLAFDLPPAGGVIEPAIAVDLADYIARTRVNIEGIELDGDRLLLVVDNHYRSITGPNELLILSRTSSPAAR